MMLQSTQTYKHYNLFYFIDKPIKMTSVTQINITSYTDIPLSVVLKIIFAF